MLGNVRIDQLDSVTYLNRKDGGCPEDAKSRIAKAQSVFFLLVEKSLQEQEEILRTKTRILKAAVMTMVK